MRIGKILPIALQIPAALKCEYSKILTVPTSTSGLQVRGMGIATVLAQTNGNQRGITTNGTN